MLPANLQQIFRIMYKQGETLIYLQVFKRYFKGFFNQFSSAGKKSTGAQFRSFRNYGRPPSRRPVSAYQHFAFAVFKGGV